MAKTIKEYVELCNKLDLRALELISMQDREATEQELERISATIEAERPQVEHYIYKKNKVSGKLDNIEGGFYGQYREGEALFVEIRKSFPRIEFDIVVQFDEESHTAVTQTYKVNDENYVLTFTRGKVMQDCFAEWAKNMKKSLNIVSSTGIEHKATYNKEFDTVDFY